MGGLWKKKKKRIFIRKGTARELCKFIYRDGCAGEMHCCSCAISIPRSEAIDKMAKAMCHSPFESCEGCIVQKKKQACKQALEGMKELAEAALNALLEGK